MGTRMERGGRYTSRNGWNGRRQYVARSCAKQEGHGSRDKCAASGPHMERAEPNAAEPFMELRESARRGRQRNMREGARWGRERNGWVNRGKENSAAKDDTHETSRQYQWVQRTQRRATCVTETRT